MIFKKKNETSVITGIEFIEVIGDMSFLTIFMWTIILLTHFSILMNSEQEDVTKNPVKIEEQIKYRKLAK